jgi:hypothetical protein
MHRPPQHQLVDQHRGQLIKQVRVVDPDDDSSLTTTG